MTTQQGVVARWILRIGAAGTYIGHGTYALLVKPSWIILLTSVGLNRQQAMQVMPWIGALDMVVALV
ncbi:MAG: hypothetical protein EBZ77_15210, partial [Chitinophagia bacterium]|nr:hypothetical protein [Chitinophagia bacterium]